MDSFKWSILALSQRAEVQRRLFPDFVPAGDELALSFEEGLRAIDVGRLTNQQQLALDALDRKILSLSGEDNADFWLSAKAFEKDPRWEEIRSLAQALAKAFEWNEETPPPSTAIYVGRKSN